MKPLVNDIQLCTALVCQSEILVFIGRQQIQKGKIVAITGSSVQVGANQFPRASCSFWGIACDAG
ncbi:MULTISPECIES: hypothetical protein [Paenibacillus]|uniref:hypothetical protein n=1 Tax=Paenibacillus TaxID=44249 RepID=UPI0022B8E5EA|nr:hypothetical protein [Paenibacillus caseinilyticus]MCZ8520421.1 hypothetical protein [Paenibacillus caseinilyticus]